MLDRITRIARGLVRGPDEVVIACGSLVEGLGNAASDIDLLVIEPGTTETARAEDRPGVPLTEQTIGEDARRPATRTAWWTPSGCPAGTCWR